VAVVYPILLRDRLELLVTLPSGLERYTVPVGSAELTAEVRRLREALQGLTRAYLPASQRLYDWLVRPIEADLEAAGIDTLVFVPDGALRTIPMAALHDGESFLVQRYGLAVTPILELVDPRPLDRSKMSLLLAGISESVQGYPALAKVPAELEAVQRLYGGQVLLDGDFVLERMEREMRESRPSLVHIASHGQFTGDPATSFLLAYDGRLTMDRLSEYVGVARFREDPLELLVLSACETAAGDDRAALGLAGLAIRVGARSAVGSLWPIGDEAASQLVMEFYRGLEDPSVTKAQALRHAQIELIESELFGHPRYWSPFLLISNWL
jgi:CHAT domain-containing protein